MFNCSLTTLLPKKFSLQLQESYEAPVVTDAQAQTAETTLLCLCKSLLPRRSESIEKYHNYTFTQGSFHLIPFILPCLVVQVPALCHSDSAGRTDSPGPASVTATTPPTLEKQTHSHQYILADLQILTFTNQTQELSLIKSSKSHLFQMIRG